ncbi:hypothetical protein Tco_0881564, partial [Tanacetum coccineum]
IKLEKFFSTPSFKWCLKPGTKPILTLAFYNATGETLERAATDRKDPNADNKRDEAIAYNTPGMGESGIYIPWKFKMASGAFCDVYDDGKIDDNDKIYYNLNGSARQVANSKKGITTRKLTFPHRFSDGLFSVANYRRYSVGLATDVTAKLELHFFD